MRSDGANVVQRRHRRSHVHASATHTGIHAIDIALKRLGRRNTLAFHEKTCWWHLSAQLFAVTQHNEHTLANDVRTKRLHQCRVGTHCNGFCTTVQHVHSLVIRRRRVTFYDGAELGRHLYTPWHHQWRRALNS